MGIRQQLHYMLLEESIAISLCTILHYRTLGWTSSVLPVNLQTHREAVTVGSITCTQQMVDDVIFIDETTVQLENNPRFNSRKEEQRSKPKPM